MALLRQDLGRQVGYTAAEAFGGVVVDALLAEPEVGESAVALAVDDHIVGFQIPEDYHVLVQGLEGQDQLANVLPSLLLWEVLFP